MYGIIICKYKHCLGYGYPKYSYAYGLPITAHNTVGRGYYSYPAAYSTQVQYTAPGYRGYYSYLAYSTQLPLWVGYKFTFQLVFKLQVKASKFQLFVKENFRTPEKSKCNIVKKNLSLSSNQHFWSLLLKVSIFYRV